MKHNPKKKVAKSWSFVHGWNRSQMILELDNNRSGLSRLIFSDQFSKPDNEMVLQKF